MPARRLDVGFGLHPAELMTSKAERGQDFGDCSVYSQKGQISGLEQDRRPFDRGVLKLLNQDNESGRQATDETMGLAKPLFTPGLKRDSNCPRDL